MEITERRKLVRWNINRQNKIKLEGTETDVVSQLQDINFKGCRISLKPTLPQHTSLKMSLFISDTSAINVEAGIIWHRFIDGNNVYGLRFTRINDTDKEKIYQFILREIPWQVDKEWWKES